MLNVIVIERGKKPYRKEISGELESCQEIVEGYIQCLNLGMGLTLVCNDEGAINGMKPTRIVGSEVIHGTFFITKTDFNNGEFIRLSEAEEDLLIRDFSHSVVGGGLPSF